MFYFFGVNGPMYPASADRLSQIAAVRGVQRTPPLRPNIAEQESAHTAAHTAIPPHAAQAGTGGRGAISAYQGTAQGPKEVRRQLYVVRDVMTRGVVTVQPQQTVQEAWALLAQKKIAQAPVLNAQGLVIGLLLRADMAPLELLPEPGAIQAALAMVLRPVKDVMVSPIPAVDEGADLRRVAHILLETGLPGLPVTDPEGHLSGFVSRTDLLRAVASDPPLDLWG